MRRKLESAVRNQSVCRRGGPHKNNVKGLDWKRLSESMSELGCGKGECDVQKQRIKRRQMLLGQDFVSTSGVIGSGQPWQSVSVGTLKIFKQRLESRCQGMHGHLALLREFHLLAWKTVNSTHSPQVSLRQRGSTPPRINSFCSLRLSLSFLIFPVALRWGFIWLAFTLGFLLGLWFSSVSRELLTYLVSGSVLDISVVWNYSSRSKNGVCAIGNLMTEWRNTIFFICGGIFFSFKWGPNVKGYWTGTVFMDRCI